MREKCTDHSEKITQQMVASPGRTAFREVCKVCGLPGVVWSFSGGLDLVIDKNIVYV